MRVSDEAAGGAFVGLASLQFGGVVVLGKLLTNSGLPVASFLAFRFGLAALLLAAALALARRPLRTAPGEGWRLALLGMVGYAVEAGLFFAAVEHGSAAAVTLLFYTYPVLVSLLAIALGRGPIAFAFGAAITFTLYLTVAEAVLKGTNSVTGSMWVSGAAAVALAAFAAATGSARLPRGWHQWGPVVGTAAFTAGAFVCLFAGLRRLGSVRTSIVAASEPLAATALAVVFLNEPLRAGTVAGGVLILAGAVAASLARGGGRSEAPEVP